MTRSMRFYLEDPTEWYSNSRGNMSVQDALELYLYLEQTPRHNIRDGLLLRTLSCSLAKTCTDKVLPQPTRCMWELNYRFRKPCNAPSTECGARNYYDAGEIVYKCCVWTLEIPDNILIGRVYCIFQSLNCLTGGGFH